MVRMYGSFRRLLFDVIKVSLIPWHICILLVNIRNNCKSPLNLPVESWNKTSTETPWGSFSARAGETIMNDLVDEILSELSLRDKVSVANLEKEDAEILQSVFTSQDRWGPGWARSGRGLKALTGWGWLSRTMRKQILVDIGKVIQFWRNQKGKGQRWLAQKLRTVPSYISRVENGHSGVSLKRIEQIAGFLNVSPHTILSGMPHPSEVEILLDLVGNPEYGITKRELEILFCARIRGKLLTRDYYLNLLSLVRSGMND